MDNSSERVPEGNLLTAAAALCLSGISLAIVFGYSAFVDNPTPTAAEKEDDSNEEGLDSTVGQAGTGRRAGG